MAVTKWEHVSGCIYGRLGWARPAVGAKLRSADYIGLVHCETAIFHT